MQTLAILKPDTIEKGVGGRILAQLLDAGFILRAARLTRLSQAEARSFYHVHKDRPFYDSLVDFMCSGPILVSVLEGEDAIQKNRELMGATNPAEAADDTIRKAFGENIERNAVHGSDAPETAKVEIAHFFSALELLEYERKA